MVITRVNPVSAAKIAGVLYLFIGLVFGAMFSVASVVGGFAADEASMGAMGLFFGMGAIILLPLFYACLGFVMTLVMTAIFNVAAGIVGGIEVDAR